MNDYRLGLYEKSMPGTLTLEEKLTYTRAAGFDYMEISIDETDEKLARLDMPAAERAALRDAIQKTGVPPRGGDRLQIREKANRPCGEHGQRKSNREEGVSPAPPARAG